MTSVETYHFMDSLALHRRISAADGDLLAPDSQSGGFLTLPAQFDRPFHDSGPDDRYFGSSDMDVTATWDLPSLAIPPSQRVLADGMLPRTHSESGTFVEPRPSDVAAMDLSRFDQVPPFKTFDLPEPSPLLRLASAGVQSHSTASSAPTTPSGPSLAFDSHSATDVSSFTSQPTPVVKSESVPASKPDASVPTTARKITTTRRRSQVDKETMALRRARHNQVEIRRRQRIADRFGVLKSLTSCPESDKGSILEAAIEKVEQLQRQVALLQAGGGRKANAEAKGRRTTVAASTRPSGEFYGSSFLSSVPGVAVMNADGVLIDWNEAFASVVGRAVPAAHAAGVSMRDIVPAESLAAFAASVKDVASGRVRTVADAFVQCRRITDNSVVPVRSMMWAVADAAGSFRYFKIIISPLDTSEAGANKAGSAVFTPAACGPTLAPAAHSRAAMAIDQKA